MPKVEIEIESKDLKDLNKDLDKTDERAKRLREAFEKIGESIEKSIVSNLADAVEGTKTLAQAAVNVLNRLKRALIEFAIQEAVSGIGGKIGNVLTRAFGVEKKARGGFVRAGTTTLVGEKGPEIFTPRSSGMVTANDKISLGGGGGITNVITVNVDANSSNVTGNNADANQLGNQIAIAIQSELINQKRAGGLLA